MAERGRKAKKRAAATKRKGPGPKPNKSTKSKSTKSKSIKSKSTTSRPLSIKPANSKSENARLKSELRAARDRQAASAEVMRLISASPGNADQTLRRIAEITERLFGASSVTLLIADGERWGQTIRVGAGSERITTAIPLAHVAITLQFMPGTVYLENRQVHVADLDDPSAIARWPGVTPARAAGSRTMSGTPLRCEERAVGALIVHRDRLAPFTDDELALLQSFADQAAIAIENARLFDQVRDRTKELAASLDELRTAQDRLVQTEKLASLGQLTAGIAHEIKNPLNFVNNFSALSVELIDELKDVLKPAALDSKVREEIDELTQMLKGNLEKVVQHGKRADSIVKNMLLHSREGSGEQRSVDINAILDESLNLAYHGARAEKPGFNITLQRDFDAGVTAIDAFPQEITRVFLNLITNGFYAAAKRKAQAGDSGFEPVLAATTKNIGHAVEIRIRDNGTGIPADVKDKIFNPFFTTKPAGEGTGLGLSMSHDIIVKQHGGSIDVTTERPVHRIHHCFADEQNLIRTDKAFAFTSSWRVAGYPGLQRRLPPSVCRYRWWSACPCA
ncbi:MAG: ATP-binding protein [Bradyrhizobium sp.]